MTKIILSFWLSLFFCSSNAQPSNKITIPPASSLKSPTRLDSCITKTLFTITKTYYNPKICQITCHNSWGMAIIQSKKNITTTQTSIKFSFQNFASCLAYLQYKKLKLMPIKKAFHALQSKYPHSVGFVTISAKHYLLFQQQYLAYIKKMPYNQKTILNSYISFFENQSHYTGGILK